MRVRYSQYDTLLAPIQEHFWVAEGAPDGPGAQTECAALSVRGTLDRTALEHALCRLLRRHEVLRSTVVEERRGPVMRTQPPPDRAPLDWIDLSVDTPAEAWSAAREAVRVFAEAGVELRTGPLLRFLVVRTADRCVLALAVHHLVADATAVRLILSEVNQDYLAVLEGAESPVPAPDLQYGDFAEWERDVLLPRAQTEDGGYWREILDRAPSALDLRLDRPRPPVKEVRGRRAEYALADSTGRALIAFARDHRTTTYAVCLAAFTALVSRSTGADDFVLGVLSSNRSVPQVENLIGQFSNTLPLRMSTEGDPGFAELAARCGRTVSEAVDHGRLPLSRIVEIAEPARDPGRTPLIQHLFLPKVDAVGDVSFGGLPTEVLEVERERGRFDTITEVEVTPSRTRVWVEYDTALYTSQGVDRLMEDYERLLAAWLAAPDTPLSRLPLGGAPKGDAPLPDLADVLGLTASDTVLLHASFTDADVVREAVERTGARVLDTGSADKPEEAGTVAAVPDGEFARYAARDGMRTLIVDGPVPRTALARLRERPGRRALRLLRLPDRTLAVADFTGLPQAWPELLHLGGEPLRIGDPDRELSPYTPGALHAGSAQTGLEARWSPRGRVEIVGGVPFTRDETAPDTGAATDDDPLLDVIRELWGEALQRSRVGPDDDFFVLGGHSMAAARLITELKDVLGVGLRIRTLFENPTPALLVAEIRRRHPQVEELLALVSSEDGIGDREVREAPGSMPPTTDEGEPIPLLAAQRQLWLAEQADPGALTHTIPLLLRIDGPLNETVLRASVGDVVRRQPGLRAEFVQVEGEPVQRVTPFGGYDVPLVDLSTLPPQERAARARLLEEETAYEGIDISAAPLLRSRLVRLSDTEHVLHLLFHHLVTDEVSMTVFMSELSESYQARVERRPSELPELSVGFRDVVTAEQEMLSGPEGDRLREFWTRTLEGAPQLRLPTDRPRPDRRTFTGEFLERRGPHELAQTLGDLALRHRTTRFTVFCAAVVALLHHLTEQTDVVVGMPTENRLLRGSELLVGCFLNVVPIRVDCSGDPAFSELVERTGTALLRSLEHQGLPFSELVEAVRPERVPNTHPIYQVTCELQLAQWLPFDIPGCRFSYELLSHGTARYDASFHTLLRPDGVSVMLEINTDIWDLDTGLTWIDQVMALLEQAGSDAGLRLSQLGVPDGAGGASR